MEQWAWRLRGGGGVFCEWNSGPGGGGGGGGGTF